MRAIDLRVWYAYCTYTGLNKREANIDIW